jgi:transcription elongation factor GreA
MAKSNLNKKSFYLTSKGLADLQSELEYLKKTKREEITKRIQDAREMGDMDENAEYDAALEEQTIVENRITELEKIIRDAKIIKEGKKDEDFVTIGSTVVVEMDGQIDEFTIVGRVEANPAKKKISNESPVGSALLGAKAGEEVEVATPIVRYKCKVIEIK